MRRPPARRGGTSFATDGSFDALLARGEHVDDFLESYNWFDVVLMGRKTYEVGLKFDVTNPYPAMKQYVFSRERG